jgi:RNA polymerase sigma factor (sigma-70 family)
MDIEKFFTSLNYFHHKSFKDSSKIGKILSKTVENEVDVFVRNSSELLDCKIVLEKKQEQHLFKKYNYLKYRIIKISKDKKIGKFKKEIEIEKRIKEILFIRELLIRCNLRLVAKYVSNNYGVNSVQYEDFFSNGYTHLMKAIDYFDYRKNYKFSTYFFNVLFRNLYRDKIAIKKHVELKESIDVEFVHDFKEKRNDYNAEFIKNALFLLEQEQKDFSFIIKKCYGLCGEKRATDTDIAKQLGISRTTLQRIKNKAINTLKKLSLSYDPIY